MAVCKYFLQGTCRYGHNCRNQHQVPSASTSTGTRPLGTSILLQPQTGASSNVDPNTLAKTVAQDMLMAEKGAQWLLSSYTPFKEKAPFPGFEDLSPEEVRWGFYEATKANNLEGYKQQLQALQQEALRKVRALQKPNAEVVRVLQEIFNNSSSGGNIFAQEAQNIFASAPKESNIFARASENIFAQPTQPSQNIFASSQPPQNIFTPSQPSQNIFTPLQTSQNLPPPPLNVFTPSQPSQNLPTPSQNIFASSQPSQNIFAPSQPPQNIPTPSQNIFASSQPSQNIFAPSQPSQNIPTPSLNVFTPSQPSQNIPPPSLNVFASSQPSQNLFASSQPPQNIFAPNKVDQVVPNGSNLYSKEEDLSEEEKKWFLSDSMDIMGIPEKPPTYEMCFKK